MEVATLLSAFEFVTGEVGALPQPVKAITAAGKSQRNGRKIWESTQQIIPKLGTIEFLNALQVLAA